MLHLYINLEYYTIEKGEKYDNINHILLKYNQFEL